MASYNYGGGYGQSNPYDNNQNSGYGNNNYGNNNYGNAPQYNSRPTQDVEMQPLTGADPYGQQQPPTSQSDPNAILNDCRAVGRAIDDLQNRLPELERVQGQYLSGSGASNRDIDVISADIMSGYRGLTDRVRRIKSLPDAGSARNRPQVESLDRRIRKAITEFQQKESRFRGQVKEQQRRQYLIVNPNATEAEIQDVVEAGADQEIFKQALDRIDRKGQATSTLNNVRQRHDAILQIEKTMIELQQLFQDLDAMVIQQEIPIQQIEQKAEETHTNLEQGNVHVAKAVVSARAARKKKWICLGIIVAIIVIVVIIILAYLGATGRLGGGNNNNGNRA